MAWGFWKKIKNAFRKAGKWINDKIIKPVVGGVKKIVGSKPVKEVVGTAVKLAPAIGAAIGGAKGNPAMGAQIGGAVQGIGTALGFGK